MKRSFLVAISLAALALPATARANGRFPEANQLVFSPNDPNHVVLRVTFGLLVSRDRGATWNWICEQAIGFNGVEDPMYAVTPSKRMLGTTFQGLARTGDQGCSWSYVDGPLAENVFIDLTTRPTDPTNILTFASSYDHQDDAGVTFFRSRLFETKDEGQTFTELDAGLDSTLLGYTVDYAATDEDRVYISAVRDPGNSPRGFLLTSRDKGLTYTEIEVPLTPVELALYIAAVDPTNADRVYLRTFSRPDKPTRLLVSEDGGATVREILTAEGPLQGFALSRDGTKIFAGGPRISIVTSPDKPPETKLNGLYVANVTDFAFTRVSTIDIHCLSLQDDGLWACSNVTNGGFVLGISQDEGKSFTPKMNFCDVKGPLDCPPGTPVTDICAPAWSSQRVFLGCEAADAGPLPVTPAEEPSSGCDCRAGAPASPWAASLAALATAIGVVLRRTRRRR